jgi:hypothetical protein
VNVSDAALNPSVEFTHSFIVDKTRPDISSVEMPGITDDIMNIAEGDISQNVKIVMTNDDVSGLTLTVGLNGKTYTNTVDYSRVTVEIPQADVRDLSDNHTVAGLSTDLSVNVSDAALNPSVEFTHSFIVDKTRPDISSVEMPGITDDIMNIAEGDISQNVKIVMTNDDVSGLTLTVGLNGKTYTNTVDYSRVTVEIPQADVRDLSDNHTVAGLSTDLSVNVSDAAGNAAAEKTYSFVIDKTAPVIDTMTLSWGTHLNITEVDTSQNVNIIMTNSTLE